jgi:hypothetical protein
MLIGCVLLPLLGWMKRLLVVQLHRQLMQLGIAETFRLGRFSRRQNIVAVDAAPAGAQAN